MKLKPGNLYYIEPWDQICEYECRNFLGLHIFIGAEIGSQTYRHVLLARALAELIKKKLIVELR